MTYIFDDIESFTDEDYFRAIKYVPEVRAEKSMRYRFMTDKKISLTAYLLLMYGLEAEYCIDRMPDIMIEKNGKPFFNDSEFSFNLSHTRRGVMCSIYRSKVGCDIEAVVKEIVPVQSIFTPEELHIIGNDRVRFTKLWTLKEAYSKCMGFGLTRKLNDMDFSEYIHEDRFEITGKRFLSSRKDDLYYSVCIDSMQEDIQQVRFIKSEELLTMRFKNGS